MSRKEEQILTSEENNKSAGHSVHSEQEQNLNTILRYAKL